MKSKHLILAAVSVMCCLLTGCGRTEINVNNYLTTEISGFDGYGNAGWEVDLGQLVKDNYQAFGLKEGYSLAEYQAVLDKIRNHVKADCDKSAELSNGDSVKYTWDNTGLKALEADYKVKFETEDVEVTVSGLPEIVELNPFDSIKIQYSGTAPNASAVIDNADLADLNLPVSVKFEISPQDGLNLGDTVHVKLQKGIYDACLTAGYRLTETEKDYTVDCLDAFLMTLDQLPADASERMEQHGHDLIEAEIASYWENPADLDSIALRGNYLLTTKEGYVQNTNNVLVYVYEIRTKDFSYYSYVEYGNIMLLSDGTCSFNLQDAVQPVGSVAFGSGYGTTFEHSGLNYIGYADLDTLFNEVVTQRVGMYDYQSTVS